jgi:hypothetical protein
MAYYGSSHDMNAWAQEQLAKAYQQQADLASARGSGASPRKTVQAQTGPGGAVLSLEITAGGMRLDPEELATEVRAAIEAAQLDFSQHTKDILGLLGEADLPEPAGYRPGLDRLDQLADDLDRLASAQRRGDL